MLMLMLANANDLSLSLSLSLSLQVEALIAEHANCTMLNVSGHTPLDLACQNGHANVSHSARFINSKKIHILLQVYTSIPYHIMWMVSIHCAMHACVKPDNKNQKLGRLGDIEFVVDYASTIALDIVLKFHKEW